VKSRYDANMEEDGSKEKKWWWGAIWKLFGPLKTKSFSNWF
jgi:hypothetical protein